MAAPADEIIIGNPPALSGFDIIQTAGCGPIIKDGWHLVDTQSVKHAKVREHGAVAGRLATVSTDKIKKTVKIASDSWDARKREVKWPVRGTDKSGQWYKIPLPTSAPEKITYEPPVASSIPTGSGGPVGSPGATGPTGPGGPTSATTATSAPLSTKARKKSDPRTDIFGEVKDAHVPYVKHSEVKDILRCIPTDKSVMVWGPPGVGKSAGIYQFAEEINAAVFEVRLGLYDPQEIKGILVPDMAKREGFTLRPDFLPPEDYEGECILFLDELSSALPPTQAAAYQLVLDRRVGNHRLPPQCRLYAAGNRATDRGVVYRLPSALANRLFHVGITPHTDSWLLWALTNDVDPRVLVHLTIYPDDLFKLDPESADTAWPSPRSWTHVSQAIKGITGPAVRVITAGYVGLPAAKSFGHSHEVYEKLKPDRIINGTHDPNNLSAEEQTVLMVSLGALSDLDNTRLENILRFSLKLSADNQMFLLRLMLDKAGDKAAELASRPAFMRHPKAAKALEHESD